MRRQISACSPRDAACRHRIRLVALAAIAALTLLAPLGQVRAQNDESASESAAIDREDAPKRSLLELIRAGGPMMIPIIGCSFLVTVFAIERAMALRRARVAPGPFVKRLLHQVSEGKLDREATLKLCQENNSPVAQMFAAGVRKWGRPAVEVEQAILDAGERAANGLRKYLRVFSGTATISPLLGLLGTVLGMIHAFNDIASASAMGRPDLLASGISEALLTTAGGLLVAIPALIASLWFVGRVDALIVELDRHGEKLVELISAEGPRGGAGRTTRREAA